MISRDRADRAEPNAIRGTLIALAISTAFWALLAGAWVLGMRLR